MINRPLLKFIIHDRGFNLSNIRTLLHRKAFPTHFSNEEIVKLRSLLQLTPNEMEQIFHMDDYVAKDTETVLDALTFLEYSIRQVYGNLRIVVQNAELGRTLLHAINSVTDNIDGSNFVSFRGNDVYPENPDLVLAFFSDIKFVLDHDKDRKLDRLFTRSFYEPSIARFTFLFNRRCKYARLPQK